jgi:hypothetical protein
LDEITVTTTGIFLWGMSDQPGGHWATGGPTWTGSWPLMGQSPGPTWIFCNLGFSKYLSTYNILVCSHPRSNTTILWDPNPEIWVLTTDVYQRRTPKSMRMSQWKKVLWRAPFNAIPLKGWSRDSLIGMNLWNQPTETRTEESFNT